MKMDSEQKQKLLEHYKYSSQDIIDLLDEIDKLKAEIGMLKMGFTPEDGSLKVRLQDENAELKEQAVKLQAGWDKCFSDLAATIDDKEQLQSAIQAFKFENAALKEQVSCFEAMRDGASVRIGNLEANNTTLKERANINTKEIELLVAKEAKVSNMLTEAICELREKRQAFDEMEREITALKEKIANSVKLVSDTLIT
jgi:chromosome segregation ATPase